MIFFKVKILDQNFKFLNKPVPNLMLRNIYKSCIQDKDGLLMIHESFKHILCFGEIVSYLEYVFNDLLL